MRIPVLKQNSYSGSSTCFSPDLSPSFSLSIYRYCHLGFLMMAMVIILISGCSNATESKLSKPTTTQTFTSKSVQFPEPFNVSQFSYQLEKQGSLNYPWGMEWVTHDELIITEKRGAIKRFNRLNKQFETISHNLTVAVVGQGGLLDVASTSQHIYVSYSSYQNDDSSDNRYTTSIARASYVSGQGQNQLQFKTIFRAQPAVNSGHHFGSRLLIHNNQLYATIGERGSGSLAQQPTNAVGSIVRLNLDGSAVADNPFSQTGYSHWQPEVYQIGVRNPQGLTYVPLLQQVYISNHGAKGGDFIGAVNFAGNYGWNTVGWGGVNYNGSPIGSGKAWLPGLDRPKHIWIPSIAVGQIAFYQGERFATLKDRLLVSSLKDRSLRVISWNSQETIQEVIIFKGKIGRIRDVSIHPNGEIYLLSDGSNGLWRMF